MRLPDGQPQRTSEQLGLGELLARTEIAVVIQRVDPAIAQRLEDRLGGVALGRTGLAEPHQVHLKRRQRAWPGDAVLVGVLLDRGRDDPCRTDAV